MKRFVKILKWTSIVLLLIIAGLLTAVYSRQNLKFTAPYPDIKASNDSVVIARGRHLVYTTAHCINCHSKHNADSLIAAGLEVPLSGGVLFDLELGKIYSKNITSDNETGIGKYTDGEIARVLRFGVHPDGRPVYDFMPFHNMTDDDLTAVISYLRTQTPVVNKVPNNQLNFMGKAVNAFLVTPVGPEGEPPKSIKQDTSAEYGRYITLYVAECNGCHTKRDMAGRYIGEPFAGGNDVEGYLTPNLTPDSTARIFGWTKETFIRRFRAGKLIPDSPMPWNSFRNMTDEELTAIYNFLRTTKPVKNLVPLKPKA